MSVLLQLEVFEANVEFFFSYFNSVVFIRTYQLSLVQGKAVKRVAKGLCVTRDKG